MLKFSDFIKIENIKIKARRLDLKLTKQAISLRLNVAIYLWEKNRIKPSLALIPRIIEFLGYDPFEAVHENLLDSIKNLRRLYGLSQKKLAGSLGIDPSTVGAWERAENQPSKPLLDKLVLFFGSFPCFSGPEG
jgi:transcriptional regulator with XRE-family HTH domain